MVRFPEKVAAGPGGAGTPRGWPVVYCADSLALAMLEVLVHLTEGCRDIVYHAFPVDPARQSHSDAPARRPSGGLAQRTHPPSTQAVGETWLQEGAILALQVPSVVVPPEANVVINPHHPDFNQITVGDPQPVGFDARIWQG